VTNKRDHFWYIAVPYSEYEGGYDAAFHLALINTAKFVSADNYAFSSVVYGHLLAKADPTLEKKSHDWWLEFCEPYLKMSTGLVVLTAKGWDTSKGVQYEIDYFKTHKPNAPIIYIADPAEAESWAKS
jgi:hypothetical protein